MASDPSGLPRADPARIAAFGLPGLFGVILLTRPILFGGVLLDELVPLVVADFHIAAVDVPALNVRRLRTRRLVLSLPGFPVRTVRRLAVESGFYLGRVVVGTAQPPGHQDQSPDGDDGDIKDGAAHGATPA
jgi:hypothetical protein